MKHPYAAVVIVLTILISLCRAASNSSGSSTTRRTNLRRGSMRTMGEQATHNIFLIDAKQPEASPRVSECLYSASTSEECTEKEGCVWCKEPLYGLCLTKELAKKMSFLPFLTCSNATTLAVVIWYLKNSSHSKKEEAMQLKFLLLCCIFIILPQSIQYVYESTDLITTTPDALD